MFPLFSRALDVGRRRRERRLQCIELERQHIAHHLHMRDDVGADDEAEIELVAIALHGDVERLPVRRDRHREDVQQLGAGCVERLPRPRTLDTVMLAAGGSTSDRFDRL